jgi:hypothetical protein
LRALTSALLHRACGAPKDRFRNEGALPTWVNMNGKLDPTSPDSWGATYREADERRRLRGWHRRGESKPWRPKLTSSRLLAIVMGLATVVVIACLVLPT